MSEVQVQDKSHASESEPEKASSVTGASDSVADENNGKDKVDHTLSTTNGNLTKTDASGSEPEASTKNADAETAAAELVNSNVEVPAEILGGEGQKEDDKNEVNNKEKVGKKLSATGANLKKRKRKKAFKPNKKAAIKNTDAETTAAVKLNVEVSAAVSGDEEKAEAKKTEESKEQENRKEENLRKRKRKKPVKKPAYSVLANDADKPESSTKGKDVKKSESKGMIFMCNSKTKQDCYDHKVFGLPANKKDTVAKIYRGMRLFLFDIDLKMLYGVYKAAGPGGYEIEPKAFKSAFPSQVRFTMLEDCLPLAEEKFKAVIKDNYYGKNKFDCQLSAEQVKNLCKLFKATTAKSGAGPSKQVSGSARKPGTRPVVDRSRERGQGRDADRRQGGRDRERRDSDRQQGGRGSDRRHGRDSDRARHRHAYAPAPAPAPREVSQREVYPSRLLPALPSATYAYERAPLDTRDYYRSETVYDRHLPLVDEAYAAYARREPLPLSHRESLYAPRVLEPPPLTYPPEVVYTTRAPLPESTLSYHDPVYTRDPPAYLPSHSVYHRY